MKPITLWLAVALLAGAFNTSQAQLPDSLQHYMSIAAANNPGVMQKYYEYQASLQKVPQVGALPDPELTAGIFLSPMELMEGKQLAEFSLMQMFPWFGVLKNAKDEMSLMAMANYESLNDAKLALFYDVSRSWYALYLSRENIRISERNMDILHTVERLALTRFTHARAGNSAASAPVAPSQSSIPGTTTSGNGSMNTMGSQSTTSSGGAPSQNMQGSAMQGSTEGTSLPDLYRIQIEIGDLQNTIEGLKNNQTTLTAQFNALLNRPPETPVYLPDSLTADSLNVPLMTLADSLIAGNPMLAMLNYEQQAYEARRIMNKRMGYPMAGVGLNYSLINKDVMSTSAMNGRDMIMPMVKVTLPIYRKKYNAMQREAVLLQSAAGSNYKSTANTLQAELYAARQTYLDAQRRMVLYKNQHLLAQKSFNIMIRSFSASDSPLTDLLRVRQQTIDYELKQVEALTGFNTAAAYIRRLTANTGLKSTN